MDPAALAAMCALLAHGGAHPTSPDVAACPPPAVPFAATGDRADLALMAERVGAPGAREAVARVAYAEAANQGDSGLAAVIYTILNRLQDGRWGDTLDGVLNARGQFEPVMRAGGDWRALPPVSAAAQARIDTILNLALDGRLPDLTHGARYFQNPAIVAARARVGQVSPRLVNFGGSAPSAIIGAHSFYVGAGRGGDSPLVAVGATARASSPATPFVGVNRAQTPADDAPPVTNTPTSAPAAAPWSGDPSQALFVLRSGVVTGPQP